MRTVLVLSLLSTVALAAPCPTRANWPTAEWPSATDQTATARAAQIKAMEDYAFTLTGTDEQRLGLRTDGVVIVKGGTIIYEKYARGWDASKRHISWSVAKSFSSALIGVSVQRGVLSLDDSVCTHVKTLRDELCKIKVKDVIEFASGLHWQEEYENSGYQVSSVISMLYGVGHTDWLKFYADHKFDAEPGTRWQYSTGEAMFLSEIARQALKASLGDDWAYAGLFNPIGMKSATLNTDLKGVPGGGSFIYATPRDYAKFGYLYLNDGCWAGERLLPEDWVSRSTTMSNSFATSAPQSEDTPNGWMWWLNQKPPKRDDRPWKDAPADAYTAIGHWGQYIIVVPSLDVVIVRTGDDRDDGLDLAKFVPLALAVAQ